MTDLQKNIGEFVGQLAMSAKASGLSWDEAVTAMGVDAKDIIANSNVRVFKH